MVQGLVFLLDFGVPWRGAIKDLFTTTALTPEAYHKHFVVKAEQKMGERVYRVSLERARATIAAALEANRHNKVALPKEYNEVRHLIERWVLHPPAAALHGQADASVDELGDIRQARPPEFWEMLSANMEEFVNFKSLLKDVNGMYQSWRGLPWWPVAWVEGYLLGLQPKATKLKGTDPEFNHLAEQWLYLRDWFGYLDDEGFDVHSAADLRGFHFSEYLVEDALAADEDGGRARIETLRAFFDYLARAGKIPSDTPGLSALAHMLARLDEFTLLERPAPLGGEVAVWLKEFGEEGKASAEPLTYNEWWMALVLEKKYTGRWDKFRNAAHQAPDVEAKLVLLDHLERRFSADPEYLEHLNDERPPAPEEYKRAERWFEKETVNEARAW